MQRSRLFHWLLAFGLLFGVSAAHAQAACPPGTIPYGGGNDPSACGPDESQAQQSYRSNGPAPIWVDQYGAIATDEPRGAMGASTGIQSREGAKSAAMSICKTNGGVNCTVVMSYGNKCVAMIVGGRFFNVRDGATVEEATIKGMKFCGEEADDCHVYYSACSLPIMLH
jgi:hypothetical protein